MQIVSTDNPALPPGAPDGTPAASREYLVFSLAGEEYALGIRQVQELRSYELVTQLANAPDFIKGVINLRGTIVPIIDMRIRFGLREPSYDAFTVVIILNIGTRVVGMVVDGVSDVVTLAPEHIKPAPQMDAAALDTSYMIGVGTLNDRMLIVVDVEKLIDSGDLILAQKLAA